MITVYDNLPDKVIGVSITGQVTGEDYKDVLVPAVEERLARHERISILYHVGPEFRRFTTTALWDDARLGMHHLRDFDRIAVVTDVGWLRTMLTATRPLIGELRLFGNAELEAARAWVSAP